MYVRNCVCEALGRADQWGGWPFAENFLDLTFRFAFTAVLSFWRLLTFSFRPSVTGQLEFFQTA